MDWNSILQQSRVDFSFILPEAMLVFFALAILLTHLHAAFEASAF